MLKNYRTTLSKIDRYALNSAYSCAKNVANWEHDPLQYAQKLLHEMEDGAEEMGETVQSTAQEIAEALLAEYVQQATYMVNRFKKIMGEDAKFSGIEYYVLRRNKATKWLEQYESANN